MENKKPLQPNTAQPIQKKLTKRDVSRKRRSLEQQRKHRLRMREFERIKHNVKKQVAGRPEVPRGDLTFPGMLGKLTAKIAIIAVILVLVAALAFGGAGLGILVGYFRTTTDIPNSLFTLEEQTSYLYDLENRELAQLTGSTNTNREIVKYTDVSPTYIDEAFMAIEDRSFEKNIGIDPRRIISLVVSTLVSMGDSAHGGSTITQQTVKMLTNEDQRSFQRKVQEWYRAVTLTEQLSKAEIMDLYLNLVPMGNSYVGIQSAAKGYFGKDAAKLNLAEAALLAGIPKSPASYNLSTELGRKNAQRRQRMVLQSMLGEGMISVAQFEEAINYEIVYSTEKERTSALDINSYFEEHAISEVTRDLMEKYGYSFAVANRMVMNGGLKIYTSQDTEKQKLLDKYFKTISYFQTYPEVYVNAPEVPQQAVVLLDNKTNTLAAMQGGYGEKTANLVFNRATQSANSPASSIKPLGVYGPAIELDLLTGATIIRDNLSYFNPETPNTPWPVNLYLGYYGDMTARDAVKISNNVPAVKVLKEVGVDNAKHYLKLMGIDLSNDQVGLALAVGGLARGPSPLVFANAYQTLSNGGQYAKVKSYTKVLDSQGTVILEHDPEFSKVFTPETSYMMLDIMKDVMLDTTGGTPYRGTMRQVGPMENSKGETIATSGKTGTADDGRDIWSVILTPYYTAVGWYGFDNRIKTTYIPEYEIWQSQTLVGDFMKEIHQDLEKVEWNQPAGIVELEIDTRNGMLAYEGSYYTRTEPFKAGNHLTPTEKYTNTMNRLESDY